jgi:hypothetical protein
LDGFRKYKWAAGTNLDAEDPATPVWFVGDTPVPLGHVDLAEPSGTMCHMKPTRDFIREIADAGAHPQAAAVRDG